MQPCTLVFVSLIAVAKSSPTAGESAWGYDETSTSAFGPTRWSEVAPQCAGFAQSPIDIEEYPLKSSNHWKTNLQISFAKQGGLVTGTLINNGHAPTLQVEKGGTGCVTLTGGPVGNSDYVLEQFHFHFGCASNIGSEHTLHGKSYPVEVHFVFYNTKYKNFADAMDKPDGLAVVGSFFELCLRANTILEKLKSKLEMIIEEGKNVSVAEKDGIYLKYLVPALNRGSPYYTYQGSLTTPPCYQSVRWILLQVPAPLNPAQLIAFNRLQARHGYAHGRMCNNFRPTQPRNGREVLLIY